MREKTKQIYSILGSKKLFWIIFLIFIFEASWIALSAVYPQAFDEDFHFGLIKVYSHYWSPFLTKQPASANSFGAVIHDPSFLYHYLMSFPYRFIALFVHGTPGQVIILRFIDIGFFAWSLVLFRKILKRVGLSNQLTNLILFLFILIPVVPQLAGQINYDDLLMPLVAISCLLTFKTIDQIKAKDPKIITLFWLLIACLTATLVKYEFGPIFLGIILYLGYLIYKNYKSQFKYLVKQLYSGWGKQSLIWKLIMIVAFVFLMAMFIERDGYNLYKYHALAPNCSQVLTTSDCSAYSVWSNNNQTHIATVNNQTHVKFMNPISYLGSWAYWMWYRLFFAVSGPNNFINYPPLPLPAAGLLIIFVLAVYSILRYGRKIFHNNPYLAFIALVSFLYLVILITDGYSVYRYTGTLELMNGRYLLPVIFFLAAIAGTAFSVSLKNSVPKKLFFSALVLIMFLDGGGLITFITRSDDTWYWSNSTVVKANHTAKKVASKLILEGSKTYETNDWFFN